MNSRGDESPPGMITSTELKNQVIGKNLILFVILSITLLFTGCLETKEVSTTEETITQVYELEGESMEDILAQLEELPDEIEIDGKTYKRVDQHIVADGETAEAGKKTVTEEYVLTNDPLILYRQQILETMRSYYVYVLVGIAATIVILAVITVLKRRWQLWY